MIMDSVSSVNASTSLANLIAASAVNPTDALFAPNTGVLTPGVFDTASTIVDLSAQGQLLSAAVTFQNQLQALKPGTATSGGGQNFGTDFASLAAEVQSFVDAFNGLQSTIANINGTGNLLGASLTGTSGLVQSLNTEAQTTFANGNSTLANLAQLGIQFNPSPLPGGGGNLSVNLGTLQSAFNTNPTGAFSLLATAANAFSGLAGNFVNQAGTLTQSSLGVELLANSLLSEAQANGDLSGLLAIESLTGVNNLQQVILAMNEFNFVAGLGG
jgi:Flagellar hook-associated protein 2 C-terminus